MSPVAKRPLGKIGPLVPRIGYGTMGLSIAYGKPASDEQRLAVLDHAHKIGATFWDTSDFYVRTTHPHHLYSLDCRALTHMTTRGMPKASSENGSPKPASAPTSSSRPSSAASLWATETCPQIEADSDSAAMRPTSARPARRAWSAWAWTTSICGTRIASTGLPPSNTLSPRW